MASRILAQSVCLGSRKMFVCLFDTLFEQQTGLIHNRCYRDANIYIRITESELRKSNEEVYWLTDGTYPFYKFIH